MIRRASPSVACRDLLARLFWLVSKGKGAWQDKRPASSLAVCGWFVSAFAYGTSSAAPYLMRDMSSFQRLAVWHAADER